MRRTDQSLRGSELNLSGGANTVVLVVREEAWRARVIRTGEIVEGRSFLELLTAPPLKGFGEDPKRVEALLRDDAEALTMFRAAITPPHIDRPKRRRSNNNVMTSKCESPLKHQEKLGVAVCQWLYAFEHDDHDARGDGCQQSQVEASAGRRIRLEDDDEPPAPPPVSGTAEGEGFRRGRRLWHAPILGWSWRSR